jgi:hypothetical protein
MLYRGKAHIQAAVNRQTHPQLAAFLASQKPGTIDDPDVIRLLDQLTLRHPLAREKFSDPDTGEWLVVAFGVTAELPSDRRLYPDRRAFEAVIKGDDGNLAERFSYLVCLGLAEIELPQLELGQMPPFDWLLLLSELRSLPRRLSYWRQLVNHRATLRYNRRRPGACMVGVQPSADAATGKLVRIPLVNSEEIVLLTGVFEQREQAKAALLRELPDHRLVEDHLSGDIEARP